MSKTIAQIQESMSEQIDKLSAGESTPATVNAIVNASALILRTVKLQMDYYRQIGRTPNIPLLLTEGEVQNGKSE